MGSILAIFSNYIQERCPKTSLEQVYENSPLDMLTGLGVQNARSDVPQQEGSVAPKNQVLGGEAMVFSYETDAESLQTTVWPRGAALAERLWTDPPHVDFLAEKAENRMAAHRERMVNRGTRAETFQPEYCFQNQNSCYTQDEYTHRQTQPTALGVDGERWGGGHEASQERDSGKEG